MRLFSGCRCLHKDASGDRNGDDNAGNGDDADVQQQ